MKETLSIEEGKFWDEFNERINDLIEITTRADVPASAEEIVKKLDDKPTFEHTIKTLPLELREEERRNALNKALQQVGEEMMQGVFSRDRERFEIRLEETRIALTDRGFFQPLDDFIEEKYEIDQSS